MSEELKAMRNVVELGIAVASFMVALLCFAISHLVLGVWGLVWLCMAVVSMGFCLVWSFEDVFCGKGRK